MRNEIALATKHGKLAQIGPAFASLSTWEIELAEIDTDLFGTFTGEVPRSLSPRDSAIAKARAGAQLLGFEYGLASEGTITAHPQLPWVIADLEILALVNTRDNFVVVESNWFLDIQAHSANVDLETDLDELMDKLALPSHAANLVILFDERRQILKGIQDREEFRSLVSEALNATPTSILAENDFRAMNSPTRQANISAVAQKLVTRISSHCPSCNQIGWGQTGYEFGLPCSFCFRLVDRVAHSEEHGCVSCDYVEIISLGEETIDPARCDFCNP
jgi:hypothetical protein